MRHPYQNFQMAQMASVGFAVILVLLWLFQMPHQWILLLMFYVLSASLLIDALIEMKRSQSANAIIQLVRASLIFIFSTILFFF